MLRKKNIVQKIDHKERRQRICTEFPRKKEEYVCPATGSSLRTRPPPRNSAARPQRPHLPVTLSRPGGPAPLPPLKPSVYHMDCLPHRTRPSTSTPFTSVSGGIVIVDGDAAFPELNTTSEIFVGGCMIINLFSATAIFSCLLFPLF